MTARSTTARAVDVHALPAMLTALRLPSFHRHWATLAECADTEGWPAARFLAALAEVELAERETRRIQRHLAESRLPGGKTLATFDFKALPSVPKARIEALAAGDWVETGANLIAIGNSGAGKTLCSAPSATPSSRPAGACSIPAPPISCRSSRPPDATFFSKRRWPSSTASI